LNGDETSVSFVECVTTLRELGVPEHVVSYVAAQKYPKSWQRGYVWHSGLFFVALLVVLSLSLAGVLMLAHYLDVARGRDALFLTSNHGLSGIPLVLAGIFAVRTATFAVSLRLEPRRLEFHAIKGLLQDTQVYRAILAPIKRWTMQKLVERAWDGRAEQFFLHYTRWMLGSSRGAALWLLAIALVTLPIDLEAYSVGTAKGVEKRSVFGDVFLPWSALGKVAVGCDAFDRRPPFANYELSFADGTSVDAWPQPRGADALAGLRKLDRQLRGRGVPFERRRFVHGARAGKLEWAPGCIERLHVIYPGVPVGDLFALLNPSK